MTIYIIIYIVFTCIFAGMMLQRNEEETLSIFDWFLIVTFGWIVAPIAILVIFGKLISFLNKYYG